MGSYFSVHGGGGVFPTTPSTATNTAAVAFLKEKAGGVMSAGALEAAAAAGVAEVVGGLMGVQGCELWECREDMAETALSREQVACVRACVRVCVRVRECVCACVCAFA
jgi:hypothetical protein